MCGKSTLPPCDSYEEYDFTHKNHMVVKSYSYVNHMVVKYTLPPCDSYGGKVVLFYT